MVGLNNSQRLYVNKLYKCKIHLYLYVSYQEVSRALEELKFKLTLTGHKIELRF